VGCVMNMGNWGAGMALLSRGGMVDSRAEGEEGFDCGGAGRLIVT
jgi:hypothetical protein